MTEFTPQDPDFEARTRASFARQTFMATLGAQMSAVRSGYVEIVMAYNDQLTQQHGYMHGVALAGIADSAAGYAAFTLMAPDESPLSVEYKVNMLRPGAGERFIARANVIKAGRTLSVVQANVFAVDADGNEKLLQTMLQTMIALAGKSDRVEFNPAGAS
ncbi:MAG: hotdog fold thioesterase [Acidobacteria bacterium]|nr:hotdog fold thioesterase [Acidobacteriota bacterium]